MDPHIWPSKSWTTHTYSSYLRIRDVALKTCLRWWTIGRSDERGSGISVLVERHDDDDDDDDIYKNIYIFSDLMPRGHFFFFLHCVRNIECHSSLSIPHECFIRKLFFLQVHETCLNKTDKSMWENNLIISSWFYSTLLACIWALFWFKEKVFITICSRHTYALANISIHLSTKVVEKVLSLAKKEEHGNTLPHLIKLGKSKLFF